MLTQSTPAFSRTPYLHTKIVIKKALEQYTKKVWIPFVFPPKTTTNPSINNLLHHMFKGLAFGERESSKERKENCETLRKNPEIPTRKPNLYSSLWIKELSIFSFVVLVDSKTSEGSSSNPKHTLQIQGKSFWLCIFSFRTSLICKYHSINVVCIIA